MYNKFKVKKKVISIALALALAAQPLATLPMNVFAGTGKNGVIKAPKTKKVTEIFIFGYPANNIIDVGKNLTLTADFFPPGAYAAYKTVEWSSSDETVATVNETTGEVSAQSAGTVTITATAKNGSDTNTDWITKDVTINVLQPVTGFSISGAPANNKINVGKDFTLTTENFEPDNAHADYKKVEWEVTGKDANGDPMPNEKISLTDNGDTTATISVSKPGTVTITATAKNGLGEDKSGEWIETSVEITVRPLATSITLNKSTLAISVNQTETLQATVLPQGADQTVTWSSDKTDVATVDQDGTVTAKEQGEATITATTSNDLSASCKVYVDVVVIKSIETPKKAENTTNLDPFIKDNLVKVSFDNKGTLCGNYLDEDGWYSRGNGATVTVEHVEGSDIIIQKCKFYTKNGFAEIIQSPFTVYSYDFKMYTQPDKGGTCFNNWGVTQIDVYFTRNANNG